MKKVLIIISVMLLVLTGCAENESYSMSIKPTELSQETQQALSIFDDEVQYFDVKYDETAKYYSMAIWAYKDGEWYEAGRTYGEIQYLNNQIAINLTESSCEIFNISKDGYASSAYPDIDTNFDSVIGITGSRVDREIPIELDKETPIWVKIGTQSFSMSAMDITEDFRNNECDAGIAVTLTISDKEIKWDKF